MASGDRAPSCAIWYDDRHPGDIILHDIMVPENGCALYSYYCCLQWNGGQEGGGYCGIQDHPNGRCYIFSIWNSDKTTTPIIPTYTGVGTVCEPFGGEGTGMKSMNFSLGWDPGQWYTILVRRWNNDNKTTFGCWVFDQKSSIWTHLVSMSFPVADIYFHSKTACFLEDWHGNGGMERSVMLKNGFKRLLDQSWFHFSNGTFNVNQEDACRMYNENYNAYSDGEVFCMQSGRNTKPNPKLIANKQLKRMPLESPKISSIEFVIVLATPTKVEWAVHGNMPQFAYSVLVDDCSLFNFVDSDARSCSFDNPGSVITLILEDLLGRRVSKSAQISNNETLF